MALRYRCHVLLLCHLVTVSRNNNQEAKNSWNIQYSNANLTKVLHRIKKTNSKCRKWALKNKQDIDKYTNHFLKVKQRYISKKVYFFKIIKTDVLCISGTLQKTTLQKTQKSQVNPYSPSINTAFFFLSLFFFFSLFHRGFKSPSLRHNPHLYFITPPILQKLFHVIRRFQ